MKLKIEKKYLILIILVVLAIFLGIVSTSLKSNRKLTIGEKIVKDSFLAITRTIYKPVGFVKEKINKVKEKEQLYEKYKKLKENSDKIESVKHQNNELKKEIKDLKDLLKIESSLSEYTYLNTTVINRNIGYWYNEITIDKGEKNGLTEGLLVVNNHGLVGVTTKISNFNSNVKLLTNSDSNNKISVKTKVGEEYIYGLLSGYDQTSKMFIVSGISENIDIEIGSIVTTTGLSGNFPSGIYIGKVNKIKKDNFDLSTTLEVKSEVNFDDLTYVTVLKRKDS